MCDIWLWIREGTAMVSLFATIYLWTVIGAAAVS
jgi:hypothetical protein